MRQPPVRELLSGVVHGSGRRLRAAALCVALAGALAGCDAVTAQPVDSQTPIEADVTISSGPMKFDTDALNAPAEVDFTILYVNEGPMPHNVAIYTDDSARTPIFVGEIIETGSIVYEVPALDAGLYFFRCDLHPSMSGTLAAD